MKIVAFLQNQWFKDPDKARQVFARKPELRERLIARYLFAGCLTGRRLREVFGELCDQIVWEETSRHVGGRSSSKFPADKGHINSVIEKHKPDVVLAFGRVASDALMAPPFPKLRVIYGPHPAARNGAVDGLKDMRRQLSQISSSDPQGER